MDYVNKLYKSKFYVYEHYIDGKIFYIGRGTGARAADLTNRSNEWNDVVKGRINEVKIKIVAHFDNLEESSKYEIEQIKNKYNAGVKLSNIIHNNEHIYQHQCKIIKSNAKNEEFDIDNIFIEVPKEYINVFLTTKEKNELIEKLNIIDDKGRKRKWFTLKQIFSKNGYQTKDMRKLINNKLTRVSIITDDKI